MDLLTRNEELLLLAVWRLQEDAYGLGVRRYLAGLLGRSVSVGAVYVPLERLQRRGLLSSQEREPTDRRGGRRKRYYQLTQKGLAALNAVREVQRQAWAGLPELALGL